MDPLKKYIETSAKVIGFRTPAEKAYDNEVLRWLHITKDMRSALDKANQKFPTLARVVSDEQLPEQESRYEYLRGHEQIVRRLKR
ncbi:MAG: hypothetical protein JNN01_11760 [Opitutaceae bacterium]|nr:hypothetical protein [Opitutaceae bacterium]